MLAGLTKVRTSKDAAARKKIPLIRDEFDKAKAPVEPKFDEQDMQMMT